MVLPLKKLAQQLGFVYDKSAKTILRSGFNLFTQRNSTHVSFFGGWIKPVLFKFFGDLVQRENFWLAELAFRRRCRQCSLRVNLSTLGAVDLRQAIRQATAHGRSSPVRHFEEIAEPFFFEQQRFRIHPTALLIVKRRKSSKSSRRYVQLPSRF